MLGVVGVMGAESAPGVPVLSFSTQHSSFSIISSHVRDATRCVGGRAAAARDGAARAALLRAVVLPGGGRADPRGGRGGLRRAGVARVAGRGGRGKLGVAGG